MRLSESAIRCFLVRLDTLKVQSRAVSWAFNVRGFKTESEQDSPETVALRTNSDS